MPKCRFLFNRGQFKAGEVYDLTSAQAQMRLEFGEIEVIEPGIDELGDVEIATGRTRKKPTETTQAQLPGAEET